MSATALVGCDDSEPSTKTDAATKFDAAAGGSAGTPDGAAGAGGSAGADAGPGAEVGPGTDTAPGQTIMAADITAATTWSATNTYILPRNKKVFVRSPATLTIEPGTVIQGESGSALLVARGAKIMAVGLKDKPIVFTSAKPAGMRKPGDWGGVTLLGKAPINTDVAAQKTDAIFEASADPDAVYGGTDPADSSGTMKYVRIEFGGEAYMADKEWNNFTLCGVGSGTEIDFIQSHRGADDGVEFFGGTVNVKHLVLTQNEDDGFDTDNGFQGKAQFIVVQSMSPKGSDASNGYESDNHPSLFTQAPRTMPTAYNVTLIGNKDYITSGSWGTRLRRGTGGKYFNHLIMDFPKGIVMVEDTATAEQVTAGNLFIKNSIFFQSVTTNPIFSEPSNAKRDAQGNITTPATGMSAAELTTASAAWSNRTVDPMLAGATSLTAPVFKPAAGSPALTGGATPTDAFFDATATFVGAVGADDWTVGWTAYPQPPAQ